MSVFADDFSGELAGPLRNYNAGPRGRIRAVSIRRDGLVDGYLLHGFDSEQDSAGLIAHRGGDFQPRGSAYWLAQLRQLHDKGLSARDAVESLAGSSGPAYAGRVGTIFENFASKRAASESMDPPVSPDPRDVSAELRRASRQDIDAALRADLPLQGIIADAVRSLDSALEVRPTPSSTIVTLTRNRASLPTTLVRGTVIHEPTYLSTMLGESDTLPPGAEVVVKLRVPEGTPAIYQDSAVPGTPGTLLLARGLEWKVLRVIEMPEQLVVTGDVVQRTASPRHRGGGTT